MVSSTTQLYPWWREYLPLMVLFVASLVVVSYAVVTLIVLFARTQLAEQGEALSQETIWRMNTNGRQEQEFGSERLGSRKVLFVMVDGLRHNAFVENAGLMSLVSNATLAPDMKLFRLNSELPTLSFPNYVSMFTGSAPGRSLGSSSAVVGD